MNAESDFYVWGVDLSTKKVAAGWAGPTCGAIKQDVDPKLKGGPRLAAIYQATRKLCGYLAVPFPPAIVLIEQPFGGKPNATLYYVTGVIQLAVHDELGVPVDTIRPDEWKKELMGHARFPKEEILGWAQEHGYVGNDPDCADAFCAAKAALAKATML